MKDPFIRPCSKIVSRATSVPQVLGCQIPAEAECLAPIRSPDDESKKWSFAVSTIRSIDSPLLTLASGLTLATNLEVSPSDEAVCPVSANNSSISGVMTGGRFTGTFNGTWPGSSGDGRSFLNVVVGDDASVRVDSMAPYVSEIRTVEPVE